jgi:hypothetical protein
MSPNNAVKFATERLKPSHEKECHMKKLIRILKRICKWLKTASRNLGTGIRIDIGDGQDGGW